MSLQHSADYCQQCVNIKQDSQKKKKINSSSPRRNWKSPSTTNKNHEKKTPPSACYGCRQFHWYNDCLHKYKICRNCNKKGHKMSSCRKLKQSRVKITQIDDQEQNVRKYLYVKIQNKKVKMQLDSGSYFKQFTRTYICCFQILHENEYV